MDFIHAFLNFFSLENIINNKEYLLLLVIKLILAIIFGVLSVLILHFITRLGKNRPLIEYPDLNLSDYEKFDFSPLYPENTTDVSTHNIKNISSQINIIRYKKHDIFYLSLIIFLVHGLFKGGGNNLPLFDKVIGIITILGFMILMGYFYYDELLKIKDIVFDFESGYFYKISLLDKLLRKNFVNISERFNISHVIGIQILEKKVKQGGATLECYELNMLLKNSQRVNILNHVHLRDISNIAAILGKRIGVNIYDETTLYYE